MRKFVLNSGFHHPDPGGCLLPGVCGDSRQGRPRSFIGAYRRPLYRAGIPQPAG